MPLPPRNFLPGSIRECRTFDDIVITLGGEKAVAYLTGVQTAAVYNWRSDGQIPCKYFWIIRRALATKDCFADPMPLFSFADDRYLPRLPTEPWQVLNEPGESQES